MITPKNLVSTTCLINSFYKCAQIKDRFLHANVNRKNDLAGERFITSRLEKCQNVEISRFYDSYRKLTID